MRPAAAPVPESIELPKTPSKPDRSRQPKRDILAMGGRLGTNVLLFIVALLVAAVVWLIYSAAPTPERHYIDSTKMQAVFLNTGQVYFGDIQSLDKDYLVLTNVFYLQSSSSNGSSSTSSSTANANDVSLIKLGCELHKPYDQMVINANEVTFWENIQDDGQVGKAVAKYDQQNPDGQKCSTQSTTNTNNPANLQSQTSNSTSNSSSK